MFKKLLVALVALVAIGGTVSAYSWWDTLQEETSETITIGEGTDLVLNVTAAVPTGKTLVPAGVVLTTNDLDQITLTYTVNLTQTALTDLNLSVIADNVKIGGLTTYASLVNIVVTNEATVNSAVDTVTVVVTLTEPADFTAYQAIINQAITFDLTFSASQS